MRGDGATNAVHRHQHPSPSPLVPAAPVDLNPADAGDGGACGMTSTWHGTHVAGTIAAKSNNGRGVTGINWNSKIQHVRVLGICGGILSDIIDAIYWAAGLDVPNTPRNATPAKVLNLSLGNRLVGDCSVSLQNAINAAVNVGAVVVVSAGNEGGDAANFLPANCNNVIAVAATGAGFNNGSLTLWIDGTPKALLSGIDNDTHRVDRIRLGAIAGLDAGTSGSYYFDAFKSTRTTYIGPTVTVEGSNVEEESTTATATMVDAKVVEEDLSLDDVGIDVAGDDDEAQGEETEAGSRQQIYLPFINR